MDELSTRATECEARVREIVQRVCGACGDSCCHQGTMVGSHDALRVIKGMALEPGRAGAVRDGLRERARELTADLDTLRAVRDLLRAANLGDQQQRDHLDSLIQQWEDFVTFISGPWDATPESLDEMLKFAGIRALVLRAIAAFPGGHSALANFAKEGSSFRFRGRRIAPPRCLFHSATRGCTLGRWKPGKCANFFCTGDPNILQELRSALSFERFVLGNSMVLSSQQAVALVKSELGLGHEYVEPKVFIQLPDEQFDEIRAALADSYGELAPLRLPAGRCMLSVSEWDELLAPLEHGGAAAVRCGSMEGAALYELAIALDLRRAQGIALPFVLVVDELAPEGPFPHPLWSDQQMSQPLGALDLFVIRRPD
ncbi:MAG: hypothetical protein QM473_02455 [Acidobacteriota bacterium]|nr:hypothetical protein [Acidobacteriota bacterium]